MIQEITRSEWDEFLNKYPHAHLLQMGEWGRFKSAFDWTAVYLSDGESGVQILFRELVMDFTIAYIPKGPVGPNPAVVIKAAKSFCKSRNAIVLYIEPDLWEDEIGSEFAGMSYDGTNELSIQPRRTIVIDLTGSEDDWLKRMKQKTRYNIRLAEKKGVEISRSDDIDIFNQLIQVTSRRDAFEVHHPDYYRDVYNLFKHAGNCELLLAEFETIPLAALLIFFRGKRAWYFYGASNNKERNRMPTYLLQFEAMRLAAAKGCTSYDLWGIPDFDTEFLEANFSTKSEDLWGVYRFKRGFGGEIKRSPGVFEVPLNRFLYPIYRVLLKLRKRSLT